MYIRCNIVTAPCGPLRGCCPTGCLRFFGGRVTRKSQPGQNTMSRKQEGLDHGQSSFGNAPVSSFSSTECHWQLHSLRSGLQTACHPNQSFSLCNGPALPLPPRRSGGKTRSRSGTTREKAELSRLTAFSTSPAVLLILSASACYCVLQGYYYATCPPLSSTRGLLRVCPGLQLTCVCVSCQRISHP